MAIQGLNRIIEQRNIQIEKKSENTEDNSNETLQLIYVYMKEKFKEQDYLLKTILDNQRVILNKLNEDNE